MSHPSTMRRSETIVVSGGDADLGRVPSQDPRHASNSGVKPTWLVAA